MSGRARANGEGSIYPRKVKGKDAGFAAYVWVTRPNGIRARKYVYGQTREETHEKWLKLHRQAQEGPVSTSTPTLGAYVRYWLTEVIKPNRAPATYANYDMFSRLYITPMIGTKRLDRLQVRDVQAWINKVARLCQCCVQDKDLRRSEKKRRCCAVGKCCESFLSTRTLADVRACLRAALNNAKDADQLISRNPAENVKLQPVRKKRGKAWSSDEARQFLESARNDVDPLNAAYVLVLTLGLRRGEALGLTWADVIWHGWDDTCDAHNEPFCLKCRDLYEPAELTIEHQLQRVAGKLYHRETKTDASDATLPLPDICAIALARSKARQDNDSATAKNAWQGSKLVFTTRLGTPVEPRNFNRSFHARCAKAGVRRIKVHDARRTCASLLADLDVHPRVVMQILRHAQFSVTMEIYTQVSSRKTREALKRLGDSLDG